MQINVLYIFPIGNLSGNNTQSLWTYLRLPTIKCTKKTNDNMATYVPWIYLHNSEIFDQFLQSSARNVQCPWWLITINRIMSKCIKGQIFGNTSVTIIFGWKQNLIFFLKKNWAQAIRKRFGLFWALNAWLSLSWELESFTGALDLVLQAPGWE